MRTLSVFAIALAVAWLGVSPANADIITFSEHVSDLDRPPGVFDAQITFNFDAGTSILTMEIANQTAAPTAYTLSGIFFNVSSDVTSMSIANNDGFTHSTLGAHASAGPFGTYDYNFDFVTPGNNGLASGDTATITFLVAGSNLTTDDFFSGFTPSCFGNIEAVARWSQGPCDDSVWATSFDSCHDVVPEPASILLVGLGLAGMALRRLRTR